MITFVSVTSRIVTGSVGGTESSIKNQKFVMLSYF